MNRVVIRTRALAKRYGDQLAVDGLDLEVREAEVFGLLGPNGSGKTTTILMLLGLTEPSAGEIAVLGLDPRRQPITVKRQVGYLPDAVGFYDDYTARENLRYTARLNGRKRAGLEAEIERALARMGLADVIDRRVATYSRGMRQRLGLAEIVLRAPRIAILDEPTVGLDPAGAGEFLDMVLALKHEGMSVLLSSHHLHQVQAICDRVGLFSRGKMVLQGTVDELASQVLGASWRVHLEAQGERLAAALQAIPGVGRVAEERKSHWLVEADNDVRPALVRAALDAGAEIRSVQMERPGLDEIYANYFRSPAAGAYA
ncbi:MAG: ABC transporter ATP-binding protein [Burkholderiales bacterium]|nr:ABC transporter ATP-binding protein [Burkholderiales bacterium]